MKKGRGMIEGLDALRNSVQGPVFAPGDEGQCDEIAGFNAAVAHAPDVVIGAATETDVQTAVRFARDRGRPVFMHCTGHGAEVPVTSGMVLSTRRLDTVAIDPASRIADIGAGVRWKHVVAAAAEHGLAPITGSSPNVGAVGFLLGGGVGPLARSHGVGSDYLVGATVVTGTGDIVNAGVAEVPDLFWALRGGKHGLGVVTGVRVRLVELATLYAGSLMFGEEHIETAFRQWIDWTGTADDRVTTSVLMMRFPALPFIPEPMRGKRFLFLRFAYPGPAADGERLAAPLRAFAPAFADEIGTMPTTEMGKIHNDPEGPVPGRVGGWLLNAADQDLASHVLSRAGAGTESPVLGLEVRHIGGAVRHDVAEGSVFSGRSANFILSWVAVNPALFHSELPKFVEGLKSAIEPWRSAENSINFMGVPRSDAEYAGAWTPAAYARLAEIRHAYDPDGLFPIRP